jgi:DNA-directed RNA polymerase subunit F
MHEPTLVKSVELLDRIQRCARHAQQLPECEAAHINDAVDSLLSALVACNGLRNQFVTLPPAMRAHYTCVTLLSRNL